MAGGASWHCRDPSGIVHEHQRPACFHRSAHPAVLRRRHPDVRLLITSVTSSTAILGASRHYIQGELKSMAKGGELGLCDLSHLFGDEKVFIATRVRQPHIDELRRLLYA